MTDVTFDDDIEDDSAFGELEARISNHGFVVLACFICALCAAAFASYFAMRHADARLEEALLSRPQIAIVDFSVIGDAIAQGHTPEDIAPLFEDLNALSARLEATGVLVLNAAMTRGGPERIQVRSSIQLPERITTSDSGSRLGSGYGQLPNDITNFLRESK